MKLVVCAFQAGFVCLTAVTTLIAGLPHYDCICPNGDHKPFCLSRPVQRNGCCCGGACCSSSPGGKCCCQGSDWGVNTKKGCCQDKQPSLKEPRSGSAVGSLCCQKTFAQSEFVAVTSAKPAAGQAFADSLSLPLPQPALVSCGPMAGRCQFSWHNYGLPPPPDLVITLQHFVI